MQKTLLTLVFIAGCIILSANAFKSILESYSVGSVYQERKKQTERQYLEVIKKKNELDYINSPFFVEKQLRESLNYYKKGEKLLIFIEPPAQTNVPKTIESQNPFLLWIDLLRNGIRDPLSESM